MSSKDAKKCCNKSKYDVLKWGYLFTSINGIAQVRSTDGNVSKLCWCIFTIIGFFATSYLVFVSVRSFYAYNTITTVGIFSELTTEFPAITICNQNRVHCGHLYDLIENCTSENIECERKDAYCNIFFMSQCIVSLKKSLKLQNRNDIDLNMVCNLCNESHSSDSFLRPKYSKVCSNDSRGFSEKEWYHSSNAIKSDFYGEYLNLTKDDMIKIAHQPKDMIKSCMYGGYEGSLSCNDLINGSVKMISPVTGICYSFNYLGLEPDRQSEPAIYGGPEFGLQIIIDIEENYYMKNGITQSSGARIVVEDNHKTPSMASKGMLVYPGTETNIGIQRSHIKRLTEPYKSRCTMEYLDKEIKSHIGNMTYSSRICMGMCYLNIIFHKCNCLFPTLVEGYEINSWFEQVKINITTCNINTKSVDFKCIVSLGIENIYSNDACRCQPECHETKYKTQISSSHWLNEEMEPQTMENTDAINESKTSSDLENKYDIDRLQCCNQSQYLGIEKNLQVSRHRNLMKINIFYESLDVEVIVESPEYPTLVELLNKLGGALSLFIGASFISLLEVLEIIMRLIYVSIF